MFRKTVAFVVVALVFCTSLQTNAMTLSELKDSWKLENLPYLKDELFSGQDSSHAKTPSREIDPNWPPSAECNGDWYDPGTKYDNILYRADGEVVLFEQQGPGVVNRLWLTYTDYDPKVNIKMYFDGETTPRVNMPLEEMFQNRHSPFLKPLCVGTNDSSGGYISYVPLLFSESLKITIDDNMSGKIYYNIGYQRLSPDEAVASFTGDEDLSDLIQLFNSLGTDPKDTSGNTAVTGQVSMEGEEEEVLADISGTKVINSIVLTGDTDEPSIINDSGRAHKGYSTFNMSIDPNNQGVKLVRRLDYKIANQKAKVYVDNALVGEWFTEGESASGCYRDVEFYIPKSFTTTKSTINIKIEYVSAEIDWNEFTYWTYCSGVLTDTLDVGDTASETSHQYVINAQNWSGSQTFVDKTLEYPITDEGRATKTYTQFKMKINPNHDQITLKRRLDYTIANQKAKVYVDGVEAGEWFTSGDVYHEFINSSFALPTNLTQGKEELTIKIQFISSSVDWNEFTYWILSDGQVTDELDVGLVESEEAHDYVIDNQKWSGTRSYMLYREATAEYLNDTFIRVYYNGETEPSVNAPLGAFFGGGTLGSAYVKAMPLGMADGRLYMYFPMPFEESAKVTLVSTTPDNRVDLNYTVEYADFSDDFDDVGYFKTEYRELLPNTTLDQDVELLRTDGRGKMVGVMQSGKMLEKQRSWGWFMEGDERFYMDKKRTPSIFGTGTEDFYNAGWYYRNGVFSNAFAGCTFKDLDSRPTRVAAYRLFVNDAMQFRNGIDAYIEHGGSNDTVSQYWTVVYYYHQPDPVLTLSDTLDIGVSDSEASHNYTIDGAVGGVRTKTAQFEGVEYSVDVTKEGRGFTGYSEFTMNIDSANKGVLLRRVLDYSIQNQKAKIYVDNELVGTWLNAGFNNFIHWREDDFFIASDYTAGKSQITIKVEYESYTGSTEWTEFLYEAWSLK